MQAYKKELKPYFYLGILLSAIGFGIGNFFWLLLGTDCFSKTNYLSTKDILTYVEQTFYRFFITPSLLGFSTGILSFLLGLLMYVRDSDHGVYRYGGEYGSACFVTPAEMKKCEGLVPENNIIASNHVKTSLFNKRLPVELRKNKNIAILGDSGAVKALAFIKTNSMQRHASFITADPNGGILPEIGLLLRKGKYKIKVLDLNMLPNSDMFNVFEYIHSGLDVDRVPEAVTEATKEREKAIGEGFQIKAESLLVYFLIAYLWSDDRRNEYTPHLGMIADMLHHLKRKDKNVPSPVEKWFEELNEAVPDNYAYRQWTSFSNLCEGETRASVLGITATCYPVFDRKEMANMVRTDTMDIDSQNREKTAVLIAIPETSTSSNSTVALMSATVRGALRNKSDQVRLGKRVLGEGKELLHAHFLIDELANIGRISHPERMLIMFRKRETSFTIVLQSLNQLQAPHRNRWQNILSGCTCLLCLGGDEEETTKYLSTRVGKQILSTRKHSMNRGNQGGGSENRDKYGRDLTDRNEVAPIGRDECLVLISKEYIFKDKKLYVFQYDRVDELAAGPISDRRYTWRRYMTDKETTLGKISVMDIIDHGEITSELKEETHVQKDMRFLFQKIEEGRIENTNNTCITAKSARRD